MQIMHHMNHKSVATETINHTFCMIHRTLEIEYEKTKSLIQ